MKIQLYDSRGRQILPISTEKAGKLVKQGRVKPISKNPPKMKLKKDSFTTGISRAIFKLYQKYGVKNVKTAGLTALIALLVVAGTIGILAHIHNKPVEPETLIETTSPLVTEPVIKETTQTKPTTTTQPTTAQQYTERTTTRETTKKSTTRRETTRETQRTTQRQTEGNPNWWKGNNEQQPATKKPTETRSTGNGLVMPGVNDLDTPDPNEEDTLPIL